MPRKKASVVEEETSEQAAVEVTVEEPVVVAEPAKTVKPDFKTQVQQLIDEAPNLSVVKNNPWTYTEWLARLNGAVLRA